MWLFPVLFIALVSAVAQQSGRGAADEIMAIAKAQWAAEMKKNTAEALKNLADDYTEFNSDFSTRIDGKDAATRLSEASLSADSTLLTAEMLNPKVQLYGDVAILSYNFAGVNKDKDGKIQNTRAKSTRVYVRKGGQWSLVHANFGADPLPD
jgi:ketosteroid isomerase-like protein